MSAYVRLCPSMSAYVRLCPPMSVYVRPLHVRLCPSMSAYVLSFLDSMRQADIDGRDTPPPPLLFSGEGNWCSTFFKRTGALLFPREGNRYSTVLERTGTLLHCFQKEFSIILFSGEYSPLFSG